MNEYWVVARRPEFHMSRVKAILIPLEHLSLAVPASVLVESSCDLATYSLPNFCQFQFLYHEFDIWLLIDIKPNTIEPIVGSHTWLTMIWTQKLLDFWSRRRVDDDLTSFFHKKFSDRKIKTKAGKLTNIQIQIWFGFLFGPLSS